MLNLARFPERFALFPVLGSILDTVSKDTEDTASPCILSASKIQGDPSRCLKPPVDFKMKVLFWPGQVITGQAKTELLF